jgi:hypothetical protein
MKTCCCCKIEKELSEFGKDPHMKDGIKSRCKECRKQYYQDNKEKILLQGKENYQKNRRRLAYYYENRDKILEKKRDYYKKHRDEELERHKKHNSLPSTRIRINNSRRSKYLNDPQYKLKAVLRARLRKAVSSDQKAGSAVQDLGCSVAYLKTYLENLFSPGMTWDNWGCEDGDWQIDHIKPLYLFDLTNREEFLQACHYTNLRPLWRYDNFSRTYEEFQ